MSPDDRILTEANKNQLRKFFERHVEFFKTEKNVNKKACKNIKIKEIHKGKSAIAVIAESKQTVKIFTEKRWARQLGGSLCYFWKVFTKKCE